VRRSVDTEWSHPFSVRVDEHKLSQKTLTPRCDCGRGHFRIGRAAQGLRHEYDIGREFAQSVDNLARTALVGEKPHLLSRH